MTTRVEGKRQFFTKDRGSLLAVNLGGTISQMINTNLGATAEQQIRLQLQMKNCAVAYIIYSPRTLYLRGFKDTPHVSDGAARHLLNCS